MYVMYHDIQLPYVFEVFVYQKNSNTILIQIES